MSLMLMRSILCDPLNEKRHKVHDTILFNTAMRGKLTRNEVMNK